MCQQCVLCLHTQVLRLVITVQDDEGISVQARLARTPLRALRCVRVHSTGLCASSQCVCARARVYAHVGACARACVCVCARV